MKENKMVSVTYELRLSGKNGEVVETSGKDNPLTFPYGAGMLLPAFENALTDKNVGDAFEIEILSNEGYGQINNDMIVNIPISAFMVEGKIDTEMLKVGNVLPMMSGDGQVLNGNVKLVETDNVTMDFNHPLAGKDLYFTGEVIDIRDMTEEELKHSCGEEGCCGDESCDGCGE